MDVAYKFSSGCAPGTCCLRPATETCRRFWNPVALEGFQSKMRRFEAIAINEVLGPLINGFRWGDFIMAIRQPTPLTYIPPARNKGFIAGLIGGNRWLISPA